MPANNFKPFAIASGANVTGQSDYEALTSLANGFQAGKASSAQVNKAIRQSTVMAYVLAQFISDSANVDVLDNGVPATILANLKAGMTALTPGRLINIQSFPVSGMYNAFPGVKKIRIRAWGAGGSGSGSATVGIGGAGGGAGGYIEITLDLNGATSFQVTIGKGGTGIPPNTVSNGVAGGDTLIPYFGINARGGGPGANATGGAPVNSVGIASLLVSGQSGQGSAAAGIGGLGGSAFGGASGVPRTGSNSDKGSMPGGASAGASNPSGGTPRGTGDGGDGLVIIEEYA